MLDGLDGTFRLGFSPCISCPTGMDVGFARLEKH